MVHSPAARPAPIPAGLIRRLAALSYDFILMAGVMFAGSLMLLPLRGGEAFAPHDPAYSAFLIVLGFGFFGLSWTRNGQTLGMRAWKIRVIVADGGRPDWTCAAIRYAAGWLSLLTLGLGFLWILADREKRAWHDLAAGTRVVHD